MSKHLTKVWQEETEKMKAFFEGMDAKIATANAVVADAEIDIHSDDTFRMWRRLWQDATPEQVQAITTMEFDNPSAQLALAAGQ